MLTRRSRILLQEHGEVGYADLALSTHKSKSEQVGFALITNGKYKIDGEV